MVRYATEVEITSWDTSKTKRPHAKQSMNRDFYTVEMLAGLINLEI